MDCRYELNYKTLGIRIKGCRKLSGLTQEELAQMTELSNNFIAKIETDNTTISLQTLVGIANALGTSIDYLLYSNELQEKEEIDIQIESMLKMLDTSDKELMLNIIRDINIYKNSK